LAQDLFLANGKIRFGFLVREFYLDTIVEKATVENGNTVFRFGDGDVLIVEGITNPNQLRDDLFII
jgi:hypothetical protein